MTTDPPDDARGKGPRPGNKWRDIGDVGAVGIEFVLCIAFGWWIGSKIDQKWFGGRGTATLIGALFGVGAAFKAIVDAAKRARLRLEELEREELAERVEKRAERARRKTP